MTSQKQMINELETAAPKTLAAIKKFVMIAAKVFGSAGKKNWRGRDKQLIAMVEFERQLEKVLFSMHDDSLITSKTTDPDVASKLEVLIQAFSRAYPNWPDAYTFIAYYLVHPEALVRIHEVQESVYAFENPLPSLG